MDTETNRARGDVPTRRIVRGDVAFTVALPEKLDRDYWAKVADRRWEPETFRLFDALLGPGRQLVDIGAWIGPTALHAAALGTGVTAFEPDPAALAKLRANLALNPDLAARIDLRPVALVPELAKGAETTALSTEEPGNSMSGAFRDAPHRLEVPAATPESAGLDALFATADLVKIDIEGGEFALLPALTPLLARHRPALHLSFHAQFLPEAQLGAARRTAMMSETVWALAPYRRLYRAESGRWRPCDGAPVETLAAMIERERAGGRGLVGSAVLATGDLPIASRQAAVRSV